MILFHHFPVKIEIFVFFFFCFCVSIYNSLNVKYSIQECIKPILYYKSRSRFTFHILFKKIITEIDQIEAGISTFEVPGRKCNLLPIGTSSGQ